MLWFLLGLAVFLIYCNLRRTFSYWTRRGVTQDPLISFLGLVKRQCLRQVSDAEIYEELYWKYPEERIVGSYFITTPLAVVRDPELIKSVLVTDFDHFYSRSLHLLEEIPEPLLNGLFSCEGDLWKLLRQSLSPAFSPRKLRAMFPMIISKAEKLQQIAIETALSGIEVDIKSLITRYTTDITGACVLGMDIDTLNNKDELLLKLGVRIFTKTMRDIIVYLLKYTVPTFFPHLHMSPPFVEETFTSLVRSVTKQRNCKPTDRNDLIDLMLELKDRGKIVGDSLVTRHINGVPCKVELQFDEMLIVAQVVSFFGAGMETSATATSCTLHILAHHPEYQRKCQQEIDEVLARHGNLLSYESIMEMNYLEMCFRESMRVFTPVGYLMRKCTKRYVIPGTQVVLEPGTLVAVPLKAIHADPRFFSDPGKFCPDRFHPDNAAKFNKYAYLPFGEGPRACIGERLGRIQSLVALAAILRHVSVAPGAQSHLIPRIERGSAIVQTISGTLPLTFTRRTRNS